MMGIALVYNGVKVRPGQEFLTATHDHYSTHESLRYEAGRGIRAARTRRPPPSRSTIPASGSS